MLRLIAKANALRLRGLIYLMRYSGLRISDAVRIGPDDIGPDGTLPVLTKKSGTHVFCVLPDFVLAALEKKPLTSARHYFWSGNGKHGTETAVKDWSERLRVDVFEPAGIKGGHSHRFRHTLCEGITAGGNSALDGFAAPGPSQHQR